MHASRGERRLAIALVLALTALAGSVIVVLADPAPYDPLSFSVQRVERIEPDTGVVTVPTVTGFDGIPAIMIGDTVPVIGVRCNIADESVDVTSDLYWARADRRGTRIQVLDDFPNVIEPPSECVPLRFENVIPEAVTARTTAPTQWYLTGSVTPTRPGGVTATWITESFWLVP